MRQGEEGGGCSLQGEGCLPRDLYFKWVVKPWESMEDGCVVEDVTGWSLSGFPRNTIWLLCVVAMHGMNGTHGPPPQQPCVAS